MAFSGTVLLQPQFSFPHHGIPDAKKQPERRVKKQVHVDYTCFTIPDEFVVGYGLDYDQKYRNLPYIGVVESAQE